MRQRVMTVYVTLLIIAGIGLAGPLSVVLAARASATMVADRTTDAARFAGLAETSVVIGAAGVMASELAVYQDLYGIEAVVVDVDGALIAASADGVDLWRLTGSASPQVSAPSERRDLPEHVRSALAGTRTTAQGTIWPWQRDPLLVAEPVVSGGEVIGVVVTASPVGAVQRSILLQWAVALAGVLALLAAGVAAAGPLTRWVMRPIEELDAATTEISQGDLRARVEVDTGPPELRRLGHSFNTMAHTITDLVTRQRTFVAYAGHQVRNPLAALRIRVEGLGIDLHGAAKEEQLQALEEVDRLTRTCDSLITLARADPERIERVPTDVDVVIERRITAWKPIAGRAQAVLRAAEIRRTHPLIVPCIDGTLEQVLDALIDNALKFGGGGVTVTVEAVDLGGRVEVRVSDDGPGLSSQQFEHAVRPFWRADGRASAGGDNAVGSSTAAGGSGLGLSVVVTLVNLQDGELSLRPRDPEGMVAVLRLPMG